MRRIVTGILVGVAITSPQPLFGQAADGAIRGKVTTRGTQPIGQAEVTVLGRSVLSDSMGQFAITGLPSGTHLVQVRRIGFLPVVYSASLTPGETKNVTIALDQGSQELPELNVTVRNAKPIEYAWTTRFDDYFRRKHVGLGRFISRQDIEKMRPLRTPNLLVGTAGIRLRFYDLTPDGTAVEFTRCTQVGVWIDGVKQTIPAVDVERDAEARGLGELLQRVIPSQIELVEIYRGPAEIPAEFIDNACAAVVIWTR